MSQTELQRLAVALQADPGIGERFRDASDAADLSARLRAAGYGITEEEAAEMARRATELSDDQLDQVAGGFVATAVAVAGTAATVVGMASLGFGMAAMLGIGIWGAVQGAKQPQ
ncbi:Nif11-like leader peptide family RiPP precursor [Azospirillum sp. A39]|uniref:Nif11-like leader peptide family RiPP precursor n=1 Tax=Azospirillum sp. A39 TaxID=3462279 RepID=UPI0040461CF5